MKRPGRVYSSITHRQLPGDGDRLPISTLTRTLDPHMRNCLKCGMEVAFDAKVCVKCGAILLTASRLSSVATRSTAPGKPVQFGKLQDDAKADLGFQSAVTRGTFLTPTMPSETFTSNSMVTLERLYVGSAPPAPVTPHTVPGKNSPRRPLTRTLRRKRCRFCGEDFTEGPIKGCHSHRGAWFEYSQCWSCCGVSSPDATKGCQKVSPHAL
eukprot:GGOE01056493.1.p1 GENE.GGOE01056493.1~~GGOE01056493.1.p1  ORF type:complete len:211 (-),score=34.13 GGOE01056493.1:220-852(-)